MTNTYVERLLMEKFKSMEGLVVDEDGHYPEIAFPNESFERPEDGYWYEVYFPSAMPLPRMSELAGRLKWIGIMQINICVPKNSGIEPLYDRYDQVSSVFTTGSIIEGSVRIVETSNTTAIDDGDYYVLPITITWSAYLDK